MNTGTLSKPIVVLSFILSLEAAFPLPLWAAGRTTVSLNRTWDMEDSRDAEAIPVVWNHKVPIPGLAHSAQTAFP
jgi:hypothetical protein